MVALPTDGQTGWGDILNTYLTTLETEANLTEANLANHSANIPTDPHGDRAYAQSIVSPIVNGVNEPNGFVQLNSSGTIPPNLIQQNTDITIDFVGGMYNKVFDCVASFEVLANGSDMSVQIQAAVTACGNAGGGVVWLGPGVFSVSDYIVLPDNCHFMMAKGCTLQRIHGVGVDAKYIFTNVRFGTSNTPADNIRISGGVIDCVGTQVLTSACTGVFLIQTTVSVIEEISFYSVFNNPCVELNGCTGHHTHKCYFDGPGSNSQSSSCPAVRINCSSSSTTPIGLSNVFYNNDTCRNVHTEHCHTRPTSFTHGCHGAICGSDLTASGHVHDHIYVSGCGTDYTSALGNAIYDNSQWTHFDNTGNLFYESAP